MNKILKKILVCLCTVLILTNFMVNSLVFAASDAEEENVSTGIESADDMAEAAKSSVYANTAKASIGARLTNGLSGIAGVLMTGPKLMAVALAQIAQGVGAGVANIGTEKGDKIFIALTPDDIIFDRVKLTSINFFDFDIDSDNIIDKIRGQIALWYYVLRAISMVILLGVLIFVGIRMAITTVASEKAIYKKALFDWATSLALIFLLQYIIRGVIWINSALVGVLGNIALGEEMQKMLDALLLMIFDPDFCVGVGATLIYCAITIQTFMFLINYIKRVLVLAFLIIISPLITLTYSIDKMGDQKAQALNTWLKEFVYNVLVQPFHGILYIVFVSMAIKSVNTIGSLGSMIFSILCIKFVWDGEKIVRKIFGFEQASSLGAAAASGAVIGSALTKAMSAGRTAASGIKYASNSKTGQLLKSKYNAGKGLGLNKFDNLRYNLATLNGNNEKAIQIVDNSKKKEERKSEKRTEKEKRRDERRAERDKFINNHEPLRKMKERKDNFKNAKDEFKGIVKDKFDNSDNKAIKGVRNLKNSVKNLANGELGQAMKADGKRFVRKMTQPEKLLGFTAGATAMMILGGVPNMGPLTVATTGWGAGKMASQKTRERRHRKEKNYEKELMTGWNNHCASTGKDPSDKEEMKRWIEEAMIKGKMNKYSETQIGEKQKKTEEDLKAAGLDIDLDRIKFDLLNGEKYDPSKYCENGEDPKQVNNIIGSFVDMVNSSIMFENTDAFDTQMEPNGFDHKDIIEDLDLSGTVSETTTVSQEINEIIDEYSSDIDIDNDEYEDILSKINVSMDEKINRALESALSSINNLSLDFTNNTSITEDQIRAALGSDVKSALESGITDLESVITSTLDRLNLGYDESKVSQISQEIVETREITKTIKEKEIINNSNNITRVVENIMDRKNNR